MTAQEGLSAIKLKHQAFNKSLGEFASYLATLSADQQPGNDKMLTLLGDYNALFNEINKVLLDVNNDPEHGFFKDENTAIQYGSELVDIITSTLKLWDIFKDITRNYSITTPSPSRNSYNTIQRFINRFKPESKEELRKIFTDWDISITNKKFQRPMSERTDRTKQLISIIVGGICILLVLAIFIFKPGNMNEDLRSVLKTLFAIGCGGISASLIGIFKFKFDQIPWATATAGVGIFLVVFNFQPVGFRDTNMPTLVFLKRKSDSTTIQYNIDLLLRINAETKKSDYASGNQSHAFQFVSSKQIDQEGEFILEDKKWMFENNKKTMKMAVRKESMDIMLIRDSASLLFKGSVSDKKGSLKNAFIELPDFPALNKKVDSNSGFVIMLPEKYEEDAVRAQIKCKGYKTKDDRFELGKYQSLTLIKQ